MTEKSYRIMLTKPTFDERLAYLRVNSVVGLDTFGFDRIFNQRFYHSSEWRKLRDAVIVRDNGCDLAVSDYPILDRIYIHHINPVTLEDLQNNVDKILDIDNLVCCSFSTHNMIHYGKSDAVLKQVVERKPNDTCPWRK